VQGEYQVVVLSAATKPSFRSVEVGERSGDDGGSLPRPQAHERVVVEAFKKLRNAARSRQTLHRDSGPSELIVSTFFINRPSWPW